MRRTPLIVALVLVLLGPDAAACLWDRDTLREEGLGQKELKEALTGRLFKHSRAFYEAKVAYTRPLVDAGNAPPERHDDLAVALSKLGRDDEAIAVLDAKERAHPGLYTTKANRGTFLAHKGDLAGATIALKAAVAQNPAAHFGREHVQLQAIAYAVRLAKDPTLAEREELLGLPIVPEDMIFVLSPGKVAAKQRPTPTVDPQAIKGLLGLIVFGSGDQSPHVWFSLGVALGWQGHKELAVRALRRAELLGHPRAAALGTALAEIIPRFGRVRRGDDHAAVWAAATRTLDAEWAKGQAWVARTQATEDALVRRRPRRAFGY